MQICSSAKTENDKDLTKIIAVFFLSEKGKLIKVSKILYDSFCRVSVKRMSELDSTLRSLLLHLKQ